MAVKDFISKQLEDLDHPLAPQTGGGWFKKDRLRILIINEDMSFREYFMKYPDSYSLDIKNKSYILVPKAIIKGKFPTLVYYFNNPFPVLFVFEYSKVTALSLRSDPAQLVGMTKEQETILANINLDAETINLAFNSRVMRGLYSNSVLTPKLILIIFIVVVVIIMVVLQATGLVDFWGAITGAKK